VTLAEAGDALGGHVSAVARLPGLASWQRVVDYRIQQIRTVPNVAVYRQSELDTAQILELGMEHVALATGSRWSRDGKGRQHPRGIPTDPDAGCLTPDDVLGGAAIDGPVVIYDDDHYFMASVLAERLASEGREVTYISPAPEVATWTRNILEQGRTQSRLISLGVALELSTAISGIDRQGVELSCVYSGRTRRLSCESLVLVTMRNPVDNLYRSLTGEDASLDEAGIRSVTRIGDCLAPGLIAAAVYSGHRYGRELDATPVSPDETPFRRELVQVDSA
jgi:dimethylamine/trimethylamine dehydrogenase